MTKPSKARMFLFAGLAFTAGVGIGSFLISPFWLIYGAGLFALVVTIIFWATARLRVFGWCLLFVSLGVLRYQLAVPQVDQDLIQFYNGQKVEFAVMVSEEPDARKDHVKLTTEVIQGIKNIPEQVSGKVLVKTALYPEYKYGDLLEVACALQAPEPIEDFAYDKYLARYDIYSVCYRPSIKVIAQNQGSIIMSALLPIKNKFMQAIQASLPEPHASFLGGLVLGAKKSIPDELMQAFSRTGTTHIVALSGYNIAIIAVLVMNACKSLWISRKKSFWASLAVIAFFILITGAQASVVRAGIMGMLVLLATQLGRLSRITNTLILAAVAMLIVNPKVLVFDAGFQLSFLATIGLVYLSPLLEKFFKWLPTVFELRTSLVATLSAIIMTTPLILFQFGRFSLVAPLVNILILPAIPIAMGFGFMTGLLSLIWLPIGQTFGWIVWTILSYVIFIVETFAKLDFASFEISGISWVWLVAGYGFLAAVLFFRKNKTAGKISAV